MFRTLGTVLFVILVTFPGIAFSQSMPIAASQKLECQKAFQEVARQVTVAFSIYEKALLAQHVILTSADEIAFRKQRTFKAMESIWGMLPDAEQCAK